MVVSRLFIFCVVIENVFAARILGVFPYPGLTHQYVFDSLLTTLADRGHELTVATFFPLEYPNSNYSEIDLRSLADLNIGDINMMNLEKPSWILNIPIIGNIVKQYNNLVINLSPSSLRICEKLIEFPPIIKALNNSYDLVIIEQFSSDCISGLLEVHGVTTPVIGISSCTPMPWTRGRLGVDHNPSYVPIVTSTFSSKMSFIERLENTLHNIMMRVIFYYKVQLKEKALIEKYYGRKISDLSDAATNIALLFVNTHYTFNGVRPLVPGLVEIGGIHLSSHKRKKIPNYIEKFINESDSGVILFSFGSRLKLDTLSKQKQDLLVRVFSNIKQRVIWKYEDSAESGTLVGDNILRVKWLPQYELLQHKNVLTIICHGGYLGLSEAISAGKPMIVIPIYGDQASNAASAKEAGVAEILSFQDLSESNLRKALDSVLSQGKQEQARLISKLWHDRETSPLDTAVYWTERVIRWGHRAPLFSDSKNLTFFQYALLDVAMFIIVFVTLLVTVLIVSLYLIIRIIKSNNKIKIE